MYAEKKDAKISYPKSYGAVALLLPIMFAGTINDPTFSNAEQPSSPSCNPIEPHFVNATSQNRSNFTPPENAIDDNLNTVWSSHATGKGNSIELDLGEQQMICFVDIAWHKGDKRMHNFSISVASRNASNDDYIAWFAQNSSGGGSSFERYDVDDISGRYVKISTNGNQWNGWAGIIEVKVYGYSSDNLNTSKFLIAVMRATVDDQRSLVDLYKAYLGQYDISLSKPDDSNLEHTTQLPGQHGVSYFSVAEIKANAAQLKSKGMDVIEYNFEESYSPSSDLEDPVSSVKKAYAIAHSNGLKLIVTPSVQLTTLHASDFARYADYYNIMAMSLQNDGCWTGFRNFVKNTTASIRETNSVIPISVELSTVRGTLANMKECYSASAEFVDGLNVWYSNDDDGLRKMQLFLDWFNNHCRESRSDEIMTKKFMVDVVGQQECRLAWLH